MELITKGRHLFAIFHYGYKVKDIENNIKEINLLISNPDENSDEDENSNVEENDAPKTVADEFYELINKLKRDQLQLSPRIR